MRPGTFRSPARSLTMICIFAWMRGSSRCTAFPFPGCRAFHIFNAFLKTDSRTEYGLRSPLQELSGCSKQSHLRLSLFHPCPAPHIFLLYRTDPECTPHCHRPIQRGCNVLHEWTPRYTLPGLRRNLRWRVRLLPGAPSVHSDHSFPHNSG